MKLSTIWAGDTSRRTGSASSLPRYASTNCDWFSMNYGQMADFASVNSSSMSAAPNGSPINASPVANGNQTSSANSSSQTTGGSTLMNLSGSAVNLLGSSNAFSASSPSANAANGNSFNGLLLNSIANQEAAAVAAVTSSLINNSSATETASSPVRLNSGASANGADLLPSNYSLKSNSKLSTSSSNYNPRKMIKTEHFSNPLGSSSNLLSSFAKLPSSNHQSHLLNGRASGASLSSASSSSSSSTASPNSSLGVPNIAGQHSSTSNNLNNNLLQTSVTNTANSLLDANDLIPTSSLLSVLTADHTASPGHQGHLNSNQLHNASNALANSSNPTHASSLSNNTSSPLHQHHLNNLNSLNNNASAATLLSLHSAAAVRNSSSASSSPITNSNTLNNISNNLIMPKNSSMMCGSASADLMSMSTAMLFNGKMILLRSIRLPIRLWDLLLKSFSPNPLSYSKFHRDLIQIGLECKSQSDTE